MEKRKCIVELKKSKNDCGNFEIPEQTRKNDTPYFASLKTIQNFCIKQLNVYICIKVSNRIRGDAKD